MNAPPVPLHRHRLLRAAAWAASTLLLLAVAIVLAARFLLLPALSHRADAIADALSHAIGQRVEIGSLSGRWSGARIQVDLRAVRLHAADGATRLELPDVEATLAWRSLLQGKPALTALTLQRPSLQVRRDAAGEVYVAGRVMHELRDAGAGPGAGGVLDSLDTLAIRDGTLTWTDELRGAPPLTFTAVDIAFTRSGDALTVSASAVPPPALARTLAVDGSLRLPDRALATATGTVSPVVRGADVAAWAPWVDLPFDITQGRGDVEATVSLLRGRAVDGRLALDVADVAARIAPDLPPLALRRVTGKASFGAPDVNGVRRVSGEEITLTPAQPADAAAIGPIAFDVGVPFDGRGETRLAVASLDLAAIERIAASIPLPAEARRMLAAAQPRGKVVRGEIRVSGPLRAPERYAVDLTVEDLALRAVGRWPGLAGLTGTLTLRPEGGAAKLESARIDHLALPGIAEPLTIDRLAGAATWTASAAGTAVTFDRLAVANRDAAAVLTGSARGDAAGDWRADLDADIERLDGARLVRYLPGLGRDAAAWMRSALVRMPLSAGRMRLQGRLADFPYTRRGSGLFEASGRITHARLAYAPGWPVLEDIDARLTLAAGNLRVQIASATLAGMNVTQAVAELPALLDKTPSTLQLDAGLRGPLAGVLRFVRESPLAATAGAAIDGWSAEGPVDVAVRLTVPLAAPAKTQPVITMNLGGNQLALGRPGVAPLTDLRGELRYAGGAFSASGLAGQAFGGPFKADVKRRADGKTSVEATGSADYGAVARAAEVPAAFAPAGTADYRVQAAFGATLESLQFESNLAQVSLPWPAPLGKRAGVAWPTRINLAGDVIDAAIGPSITAKLRLRRGSGRTTIDRGAVAIGAGPATLPTQPGLRVALQAERLDADPLIEWARRGSASTGAGSAGGAAGGGPALAELRVVTPQLTLIDRRFNDVDLRLTPDGAQRWQIQVQSREIAGRLNYATAGRGMLTARLQRLQPPEPGGGPVRAGTGAEPFVLPSMDLQVERFMMLDRNFGRLELAATSTGTQWQLRRLALTLPSCRLDASGASDPRAGATPPRSSIDFTATLTDIGQCLTELGRPAEVSGGTGSVAGTLAWRAPITDFDVATLSGNLKLDARNGRFLQVRQGMAGTLLSVLSLRALGDIATLNFRSAFTDGFRFTAVQGTATVADGVLSTSDFGMQGPAATVAIHGTADLRRETQDLEVRVAPVLGTAVSTGLAIVNPLLGAGAFVANRLFRPDSAGLVSFDHRITGTFAAPVVDQGRR